MDKSRVEPTMFLIEKISFSLKLFSGHFYGQSFIKTVRGPFRVIIRLSVNPIDTLFNAKICKFVVVFLACVFFFVFVFLFQNFAERGITAISKAGKNV